LIIINMFYKIKNMNLKLMNMIVLELNANIIYVLDVF
jgi:hypothetical protein